MQPPTLQSNVSETPYRNSFKFHTNMLNDLLCYLMLHMLKSFQRFVFCESLSHETPCIWTEIAFDVNNTALLKINKFDLGKEYFIAW